jgi:GDP-L-fucose synthase
MRVLVTGGGGLVGSAMVSLFKSKGFEVTAPNSSELNLLDKMQVRNFFGSRQFDLVVHAAARVGGVLGNQTFPATFISENLQIQNNVLDEAARSRTEKLVFVASSCIYPPTANLPLREESLFMGKFERSNRWYATAKAAGIMQVEAVRLQYGLNWFSVLPTNIYGINDNFALESGHVVPSLLRKFAEAIRDGADSVTIWGTGNPRREFLHADDFANAINQLLLTDLELNEPFMVNVGSSEEVSILELANLICAISGFKGRVEFDNNFPDGVYQKTLDSRILRRANWEPKISLDAGLRSTFAWVAQNLDTLRKNEITEIETRLGVN